jgi:hypothetical protein
MSDDAFFRSVGGVPLAQGAGPARWNFGWHDRPGEVARVLATLPFPRFAAAAPNLAGTGEGKTVLLSDAAKKVLGRHMAAQNQPRGTCVSRGWSRAVDYLQLADMALRGKAAEFRYASHAYIYGCGAEVGGDQNYQDGLVGAWAAKAVTVFGVATNEECQDRDAGYDDLAVEWKAKGVPQKYKDLGKDNLVRTVSLVTTPEQARDALCNGYPVSCCSGQGFSMTRDAQGFCRAQGSWSHCMMWSAYRDDRKQFLVEQSWGQNTPNGPLGDLDIPDNAFWIAWDVASRMLSGEDSFALSQFDGWPAQEISWIP